MGKLWAIVQAHMDEQAPYRPSERAVARALGITPTALARWRAPRSLPNVENLQSLARLTGVSYETVLDAALEDTGYVLSESDAEKTPLEQDGYGLAANEAPSEGTMRERWNAAHAGKGEESQDPGDWESA